MGADRKLVSVITGTYARPRLLYECLWNVRQQTYPNIEHCIVHDGIAEQLVRDIVDVSNNASNVPIKYVETGRQWSQFLQASVSAVPYQVAQWLASGDYLMWLADDEELEPEHVLSLVDLLESTDVDFVYSKSEVYFNTELRRADGSPYKVNNMIIGSDPPRHGQITQALFRVELLDYAGFTTHVGSGTDWYQIERWMQAGASWAFLPQVTHTHRIDKIGDSGPSYRPNRQPLRGQRESTSDNS